MASSKYIRIKYSDSGAGTDGLIVELLRQHKDLTVSEISELLNINRRTIYDHVWKLLKNNIIGERMALLQDTITGRRRWSKVFYLREKR